jgi:heat shock 70kDa protein 4
VDIKALKKPMVRLKAQIEKVKKMLSSKYEAVLNVEALYQDLDVSIMITRNEQTEMITPFLEQICPLFDQARSVANWQKEINFVDGRNNSDSQY